MYILNELLSVITPRTKFKYRGHPRQKSFLLPDVDNSCQVDALYAHIAVIAKLSI